MVWTSNFEFLAFQWTYPYRFPESIPDSLDTAGNLPLVFFPLRPVSLAAQDVTLSR